MFLPEGEWLVFNLKSFHAATGVKGLEGKFEVLMQDRYTFSVAVLVDVRLENHQDSGLRERVPGRFGEVASYEIHF